MTEFWVEVNIIPMDKNADDILVIAVKPIVDYFKGQIEAWHFLRETDPINKSHIRFRIRTQQESQLSVVRTKMESVLKPLKGNEIEDFYYGVHGTPENNTKKKYEGEEKSYGAKTWQIMQKTMEHTSNDVIELITKRPIEIPEEHYAERCIHFFLNQLGYDRYQEASLHHSWSIGNLLIVYGIVQTRDEFTSLKKKYFDRFPEDKQKQ
jgi:hypothetical protein